MKTIISEKNTACKAASLKIAELIRKKPDACIAFSVIDIPAELFEAVIETENVDFSKVTVFSVGEYVPDEKTGKLLWDIFLDKINVCKENCILLNESSYSDYDEIIASHGGLDMIVLGLGNNCRIGFNEPGTPFSSKTHIQKLSDVSAGSNQKAMTLGIKSITDAKEIIVIAFGEDKSEALFRMLYARNDPATPAAFLQIPSDVYVYADRAAAVKL